MDSELDKEAPNVVTEPGFRHLLANGYQAEVVCKAEAHRKASVWYGEWIVRVINDQQTIEKVLVTSPRRVGTIDEVKVRTFKTINGLVSFMHEMGLSHLDVPFQRGGRSRQSLPVESADASDS